MTQQEMERLLPLHCYAYLPEIKEIVIILRGEKNYVQSPVLPLTGPKIEAAEGELSVLRMNTKDGVTMQQAAAMRAGMKLGWDNPAADPRNYDPFTGRLRHRKPHSPER